MDKNIFRDRERAEEAAYFLQRDAKLIEKLREKAKLTEVAHALAEKLHVDNPDLLRRIVEFGVTLDTGAAFLLSPLVEVAWADGHVSREERDTVLRLAAERGVEPGTPDQAQLLKWLDARPPTGLFETALEAIAVGLSVLPRDEADERVARTLTACQLVADASEGIPKLLHLRSRVTPQEQATLDAIRAGLTGGRR
jgi:hypothetical protein